MSYDLYCFRTSSDIPTLEEAQAVVESEELDVRSEDSAMQERKRQIVEALLRHNPRLQRVEFDYAEIARARNIPEEQARKQFTHVELNSPQGDPAIQITVFGDHVSVNMPYWYTGPDADAAFEKLLGYLQVIRRTAGYFVYDPQSERIFDPEKEGLGEHESYERIVRDLPAMAAKVAKDLKRPWWKFW